MRLHGLLHVAAAENQGLPGNIMLRNFISTACPGVLNVTLQLVFNRGR